MIDVTTKMTENRVPGTAWPLALGATALLGSLAASCMFPFTAFVMLAAATMPLRRAVLALIAAWLVDQMIGFGMLGYPHTIFAAECGLGLLVSSLCALAVAQVVMRPQRGPVGPGSLAAAFGLAFIVYEVTLYFGATLIGGTETFATPIVLQIARNELVWFIGLVLVWSMLRRAVPTWFARAPQYA